MNAPSPSRSAARLALLMLLVAALPCPPAFAVEWSGRDGLSGWDMINVVQVERTPDGLRLVGRGNDQFSLATPRGAVQEAARVKLNVRTAYVDAMVTCAILSRGVALAQTTRPLPPGASWKTLEFLFDRDRNGAARADTVGIMFSHAKTVELGSVVVSGPSFSEFFTIQGLKRYTVNFLHPFTIYGRSLSVVLAAAAAFAGLMILVLASRRRWEQGVLPMLCLVFLGATLILDLREAVEELAVVRAHTIDYLTADPSDATYHWWGSLPAIADAVGKRAGRRSDRVLYAGDSGNASYLGYLLYPLPITLGTGDQTAARLVVLSGIVDLHLENNILYEDGKPYLTGGKGMAFGTRSFVYYWP